MPTLRIYDYWELTDANGAPHHGGSRSEPVDVEIDGYIDDDVISLATAYQVTLWNSAEAITEFDFFWLVSDQDLKLELTVDRGADNGLEELVVIVAAGTPFRLIYNDALANYSGTLSAGTADVIDEIVVRNESGSTASIRRVIVT